MMSPNTVSKPGKTKEVSFVPVYKMHLLQIDTAFANIQTYIQEVSDSQ